MKRSPDEQAEKFIGFLMSQHGPTGRANLAELRRAAADPLSDYRDVRILGDYLPALDDRSVDAYRLTASLFALYATKFWDKAGQLELPPFGPKEKRRSLGASLRRLKYQLGAGQDSLDLRFSALLDTPREALAVPLRGIIQRLSTAEGRIPVDFRRLLTDLLYWNADHTRRYWAMDYWQAAIQGDEAGDQPDASPAESNERV
jgi:CRISPR type I-E-associated protein CasB/Cse2